MRTPSAHEAFLLLRADAQQRLKQLRATDPTHYVPPVPSDLGEGQRQVREALDLDASMAALPPAGGSIRGPAGIRMRAHIKADISDALLREFAVDTLKAFRCSRQYLDTLRIVFGNQAKAERMGYVLELNVRVDFAPARVLRTIIGQMRAAGLTSERSVGLGPGRRTVLQCVGKDKHKDRRWTQATADDLNAMYRETEAEDDQRLVAATARGDAPATAEPCDAIKAEDVPYCWSP